MNPSLRIGGAVLALGLLGATAGSPALAADGGGRGTDAWWYTAMKIADAHKIATGKGVTIAVIDGPIDLSVPELRGQDVKAVKSFCSPKATSTGEPADHATTIAVELVGNGKGTLPGGRGVAGIAPGAAVRTYAVDTGVAEKLSCGPKTVDSAVAEAIDAAAADGARIINLSIGTGPNRAVIEAVTRALSKDLVIVAAAGNGDKVTTVDYPAAYPGVVAVAAVDKNAKPWKLNVKGNRDAFVISAPGVDVPSAGFDGSKWRSDAQADGTSLAAPLVAGALALVAEKYPQATANQLIQHLIHNPGGSQTFGKDDEVGYGIVSVTKMLASDPAQWPDVNPLADAGPEPAGAPAATPAASVDGSPVAATGADDGGGGSAGPIVGGVAAVLVIGAAVGFFVMRRRAAGAG